MKEKKKSAFSWILTWAGQKRISYAWSVLLAIGNVIFKIFPYFIIADVVKLFLNGEKEFEKYLVKAVLIALSFIIAELFHSFSTELSHKATFAVLANIRKACCDKLASYVIRELAITSPRTQFGRANAVAMIQILAGMVIILVINFAYSVSFKKEKH